MQSGPTAHYMILFSLKILTLYSREFEDDFMLLLRRRFGRLLMQLGVLID